MPEYEVARYFDLRAPAGTPVDIVRRLNAEIMKSLGTPEINEAIEEMGLDPTPTTLKQYATIIAEGGAK